MIEGVPRLLIDNHEPFGYHVHVSLPRDHHARQLLKLENYQEALDEFWRLAKEIVENED